MPTSSTKMPRVSESITNWESRSHCETFPRKVERSNAFDWSVFHQKPERDHLDRSVRVGLYERSRACKSWYGPRTWLVKVFSVNLISELLSYLQTGNRYLFSTTSVYCLHEKSRHYTKPLPAGCHCFDLVSIEPVSCSL